MTGNSLKIVLHVDDDISLERICFFLGLPCIISASLSAFHYTAFFKPFNRKQPYGTMYYILENYMVDTESGICYRKGIKNLRLS